MKSDCAKSAFFAQDFETQYRWYLQRAGEEVAGRFLEAVLATLRDLSNNPKIGRRRSFAHPALQGMRSWRVNPPFAAHLIFYRPEPPGVVVERLLHGARNLPLRLSEPPDPI